MKTAALATLAATLLLTGCLATAPKNETSASASTTTAQAPAAPAQEKAAPAAANAAPAAAVPCKPAPAAAAASKGKAKAQPQAKGKKGEKEAVVAASAEPCKPAGATASAPAPAPEKVAAAAPADKGNGARREVKGINDWTGYTEGVAAPGSKFSKLQIGMGPKEVTDLIGQPTDQRSHVTGKAWIPFYFGSGSHETYFYYKGVGRLLFAGNAGFSTGSGLIGIEHDVNEGGYGR